MKKTLAIMATVAALAETTMTVARTTGATTTTAPTGS